MTQLPLFPHDADDLLAAIRRQRRALWRGERGGSRHLDMAALGGLAPDPLCAPDVGLEDGPVGVLGWPKAAPGDPAWERWGFVVIDVSRRQARVLHRHGQV